MLLPRREPETALSPSAERIVAAYRAGGILDPPAPKALGQLLGMKPQIALGLVEHLVARGELVRLPGDWIVARTAVESVIERLRATPLEAIDVAGFKELFGLTRRLAIPLLGQLAAMGVVVREGSVNRIVREGPASAGAAPDTLMPA